ncbi:MAG: amino acid permease, partial [Verrucomicrobia bacterium]|nr:amino acid permease [Verrucomicrobiota bacterium]
TLTVAVIYFFNSFGIMGVVPADILAGSSAPYVDAAKELFGLGGNIIIGLVAFIACIGTLNAWILTSGQIAVQASKDKLLPPLFSKTNKAGAPYVSILIAFVCTLILLIFTLNADILTQINTVIDVSVTTFILIYLTCALSLIKILVKKEDKRSLKYFVIPALAILFCLWILAFISFFSLFLCSLFVLSGIPIYIKQHKKIKNSGFFDL